MPTKPDLLVVGFHQFALAPGKLMIRLLVSNLGPAASPAAKPGVYVNAVNPHPPTGVNEIQVQESSALPALASGTSCVVTATFSAAELAQKGVEYCEVLLDPKNIVNERNESNNYFRFPVVHGS